MAESFGPTIERQLRELHREVSMKLAYGDTSGQTEALLFITQLASIIGKFCDTCSGTGVHPSGARCLTCDGVTHDFTTGGKF